MLMLHFAKISRLSRLVNFAVCGILLSTASIKTENSSVLAQEIKFPATPLLISQTRKLRAESGPDNQGRWRFYKPDDVSSDAMRSQGCTDVGSGGASDANWRCPRKSIKVDVDNDSGYNDSRRRNFNYGNSTRELRGQSGPDNQGRWRFYKPDDVSLDAMRSQGCTDVGSSGVSDANWRCPRKSIRVDVDNDSGYDDSRRRNFNYGNSTRELRGQSGPDNQGRWRFYKPDDVSLDAMRSQGCTDVGSSGVSDANWRCPRKSIRVDVDNDSGYDDSRRRNFNDRNFTRELRAESGPDNEGRWRFYKPDDVSLDAMQSQGCTDVGSSGASDANWRCPRKSIRVEVDNRR
ncbi:MAG: hypothetical protein V7L25_13425 [Nostoc sp.]